MSDFDFSSTVETKPKRGAGVDSSRRAAPSTMPQAKLPREVAEAVTGDSGESEAEKTEKPKYDADELAKIFDDIIFAGEYAEDVTIRGKLKVRFRSRTTEEIEQISLVVDGTTANLVATLAEKRSILNLQYALVVFQGKDLRPMSVEDRAKFVKRLPGPVVGALLTELYKFDEKVFAACQDGEANF